MHIFIITMIYLFIFLILYDVCQAEIYAIRSDNQFYYEEFEDAPAQFGPGLKEGSIRGLLVEPDPPETGACIKINPPPSIDLLKKWILLIPRYNNYTNCSFEQKIRIAQEAEYNAVIVYNVGSDELIPMAAANGTGINIPSVFVGETSGLELKGFTHPDYFVVITAESHFNIQTQLLIPFAIVVGICFIVMIIFMIIKFIKDRRRQRRHRLSTSTLNKIPTRKYQKGDPYETCAICLDDYVEGEKLRILPCNHGYHSKCIDPWLTKNRRVCPICKRKVFAQDEPHDDSDSDASSDDTTPLINARVDRATRGGTFEEQAENPIQRAARSVSQQSGAANFITASDRHSINGDYQSISSGTTSEDDSSIHSCDNLQVHVHSPDNTSTDSSNRNVHINV